jgi:beta-glucosidase
LLVVSSAVSVVATAQGWEGLPPWLMGAGNSAFQVEGSPIESDWSRWTKTPGRIHDGSNADVATSFWTRYDEDFALAQKLGSNAFRVSIAWERVEPKEGVFDEKALDGYAAMIAAMRKRGLEPLVTLHHFVNPAWLADKGGLEAPDFPELFVRYAEKVVDRLVVAPASVRLWMSFNEPMVLTHTGYLKGHWPPGRKDDARGTIRASAAMARAHLRAVSLLRARHPSTLWSVASHWRDFQPVGKWLDPWFAKLSNWAFNAQFMDSVRTGKVLFWMPGSELVRDRIEIADGKPGLDWFALNYYGRMMIEFTPKPPFVVTSEGSGPKQDLGWEMYPAGLLNAVRQIGARYPGLPIVVTENGLADAGDRWRAKFIAEHLDSLKVARSEGLPVRGYVHWSLTDNFEWAEGLGSRFGLVEVDYSTGARKPRPSFDAYGALVREWLGESAKK